MMRIHNKHPLIFRQDADLYANYSSMPSDWHQVVSSIAEYLTEQTNTWRVDELISDILKQQGGDKTLQLTANMLRESVLPKLESGKRSTASLIDGTLATKERMEDITETMLAENKSAPSIEQKLRSLPVSTYYLPHYVAMSQGVATVNRNLAILENKLKAFHYNAERAAAAAAAKKDSVTQAAGMFAHTEVKENPAEQLVDKRVYVIRFV